MAHNHSQTGESHNHAHPAPNSFGKAFALAISLNIIFVIIEFTYGIIINSTALMADAGHNLSDVLGLMIAWGAVILAKKQATAKYTYGLGSASILAALANAVLLLVACGAIGWEAIQRFSQPVPVAGLTVSMVAGVGIIVNSISAWLFMRGAKDDLNIRGAYLHMAADALVSFGVVVAGILMFYTHWNWIDPLMSLIIVAVILFGTWGLLQDSVILSLGGVPSHINYDDVKQYFSSYKGVTEVHDLHIWSLSTSKVALTVHLVMPNGYSNSDLTEMSHEMEHDFSIGHVTIQVEKLPIRHETEC